MSGPRAGQGLPALFGKLPTVLDYVRIQHDSQVGIELDAWLQQAVQTLAEAGGAWPAERLRFVFVPRAGGPAAVGVLMPSRDRAGRKFPLSLFRELSLSAFASDLAALPLALAPFWDAANVCLDDLTTMNKDAARARLSSFDAQPGPSVQALASCAELLAGLGCEEFEQAMFDSSGGRLNAALRLLRDTVERRGARAWSLDVPAAVVEDVVAWLALSVPRGVPQPVSMFWSGDGSEGRLLLCFGAPSGQVPLWLSDRTRSSERLFRLVAETLAGEAELTVDSLPTSLSVLRANELEAFARSPVKVAP